MTAADVSAPPALTLTLFGPMQVSVGGRPLAHLRSRKALALLALLALRHGRPVEREWLAGSLWPDADPEQAATSLRPILSELRRALGDQAGRILSPSRHSLCLERAGVAVDVAEFDAAIASQKPPALERAVALYLGPLLEGSTEEWAGQERDVREQDCLRALGILAEAALAAGDTGTAATLFRRAVGLAPGWEAARRGLMSSLARSGDRNGALQVYREFVDLLRSDPKAVPDEQTSTLYARLRSDAKQQAAKSAWTGSAAIEAAAPTVSGHLTYPLTALIGREDERLEVAERLKRSRLVTLTGPGGIGKTRLAIEVASEVVAGFADGVWLVSLDSLSDRKMLSRQIATVLGLKEEPGRACLATVTDQVRTKRLLLVLDNCEHLLEESAQVAGHLLRECAGVCILATSREALGITGETAWTVPSLSVPDPAHLPAGHATLLRVLMSYEGVQLFVERAQAAQKSFSLRAENARLVAQVCYRLEGIPLAIELAAARVRALTVEQIAARLDDHLALLTGGDRAAPSRQRTLRAALDWSHALLGASGQLLLVRASVFAGGWTLEAAEAVCSGGGVEARQVLDLLTGLVDKSLVIFQEGEAGGRYRLQETVRQYAAERLGASDEAQTVRARHRDCFLALAEAAEPQLTGHGEEQWVRRLETEHGNLRAAMRWGGQDPRGAEAGLRLAGALLRFWELRGYFSEGQAYLSAALGREGAGARAAGRIKALNAAGALAFYLDGYESAQALHEEALAISREIGDRHGVAWSLHHLGNVTYDQVGFGAAKAFHEESLAIFRSLADRLGIGRVLNGLGRVAGSGGDYEAAEALHGEALAISREIGDRQGDAWSLHHLGNVAFYQVNYGAAQALHGESLAIFRSLADRQGIAWSLYDLGNLAYDQGDYSAAQVLHEEGLAIQRELKNRLGISRTLNSLGRVVGAGGDYEAAEAWHGEALAISREIGDRQGAAWSLQHLGNLAVAKEDYGPAQALHEESLVIFRSLPDRPGIAWSLRHLGALAVAKEDFEAAQALHEESLAISRELADWQGVGRSLNSLEGVAGAQGDYGAAQALREEYVNIREVWVAEAPWRQS